MLSDVSTWLAMFSLRQMWLWQAHVQPVQQCPSTLCQVVRMERKLALVLEFASADMDMVIQDPSIMLGPADVKAYMRMLLQVQPGWGARAIQSTAMVVA